MKTLTLIRHAKSDWGDPLLADFDRPLNSRGKKNAPEMGRRLAARHVHPDLIVSSPARRALSTANRIAKVLDYDRQAIVTEARIYEADLTTLLAVVNSLEETAGHVLLFGHSPGITLLGNGLADADISNIPTCGVLSIGFELDSWQAIWPGSGRTLFYDYPKKVQQ